MFAIIDDQQELLVLQRGRQGLDRGGRNTEADAQDVPNDGRDQLRITERCEFRQPYAVRIVIEDRTSCLDRKPRLPDATRTGQRQQTMTVQACFDFCKIAFASDEAGQLLRKIIGRGRGSRSGLVEDGGRQGPGRGRALALHRRHEAIAPSGDREQVALAVARRAQHLAQRGNVDLNVIFFHHDPGPDLGHEFVLGHQLAVAAHQQQQDIKGPLTERHRHTVRQQFAPRDQQTERAEHECFGHQRYPGRCEFTCDSVNRRVSRLQPSRRS